MFVNYSYKRCWTTRLQELNEGEESLAAVRCRVACGGASRGGSGPYDLPEQLVPGQSSWRVQDGWTVGHVWSTRHWTVPAAERRPLNGLAESVWEVHDKWTACMPRATAIGRRLQLKVPNPMVCFGPPGKSMTGGTPGMSGPLVIGWCPQLKAARPLVWPSLSARSMTGGLRAGLGLPSLGGTCS